MDARALGLTFEALVFVTMHAADHVTLQAFESAVIDIDNVLQAQRLFGDPIICSASQPETCLPFNSCTTTVSPASPGCSGSAPPL